MHGREDIGSQRPSRRDEGGPTDSHECCHQGDAAGHEPHAAGGSPGGCCGGGAGGGGGSCGCHAEEQVYVFSRASIRELDRVATSEFHMPSIVLMENAARGCAQAIIQGLSTIDDAAVVVLCGPGNNGGDGLAIARHLSNADIHVAVVMADGAGTKSPDSSTNLAIVRAMSIPVIQSGPDAPAAFKRAADAIGKPHVLVDALLGTGVDRAVTGDLAETIRYVNGWSQGGEDAPTVISIDIPSGMDSDTGEPAGGADGISIRADYTLTLAGVKEGFLNIAAQKLLGEVMVVDIGVPMELVRRLGRPLDQRKHDPAPRR